MSTSKPLYNDTSTKIAIYSKLFKLPPKYEDEPLKSACESSEDGGSLGISWNEKEL